MQWSRPCRPLQPHLLAHLHPEFQLPQNAGNNQSSYSHTPPPMAQLSISPWAPVPTSPTGWVCALPLCFPPHPDPRQSAHWVVIICFLDSLPTTTTKQRAP